VPTQTNLLTAMEVAAALRLKPFTVTRMFSDGVVPGAFKLEKSWRITQADLDAYIQSRREQAAS
jgi:predicted DNA-binding transcriptional regulator AlpA